jgi:hypothetical protein
MGGTAWRLPRAVLLRNLSRLGADRTLLLAPLPPLRAALLAVPLEVPRLSAAVRTPFFAAGCRLLRTRNR